MLAYKTSKIIRRVGQAKREIIGNDRREKIKTFRSEANGLVNLSSINEPILSKSEEWVSVFLR